MAGYVDGSIPDYQMSALLMAIFFQGMNGAETAALTEAMLRSGEVLDFSSLGKIAVDKHSTGGVGDKTSLIIAPIVAAAGVPVPMISGRGLGHTGGTLDKLESIPGFRVDIGLEGLRQQMGTLGFAMVGQSAEICPADKKMYALRDVTATVESIPLICASIMSKKLAEGIGGLVLDVKYGSGAFMKTLETAEDLADKLMEIGHRHGKKVVALLTRMDQPLGHFVGNALEVGECIAIMKGESFLGRNTFADCRELSLQLAGEMIWLGGASVDPQSGIAMARKILESGQAWTQFERMCEAQGGRILALPQAENRIDIVSDREGYVSAFDTEGVGLAALIIGAGRAKSSDTIDPTAGVEVHVKLGDRISKGDRIYTLYAGAPSGVSRFKEAEVRLLSATTISLQKPDVPALMTKRKVA